MNGLMLRERVLIGYLSSVRPCLCGCRDELFRQSLSRLREQVVKANTLVREANFVAEEMNMLTDYQVTLQIPAANLSTNRKVRTPSGRSPPPGSVRAASR